MALPVVITGLDRERAAQDPLVADDGGACAHRGREPFVRVDRERVVRRHVAVTLAHPIIQESEAAVRPVHVQPDAPLVRDPRKLREGIDATRVDVARAPHHRDLRAPGRQILVEGGLKEVQVDRAGSVERDGTQVASPHPEHAKGPPHHVVRLRARVDPRLDHALDAVQRWPETQTLTRVLAGRADTDQVRRRTAGGERSHRGRREAEQLDEPAHRQVVHEIARARPPALRHRHCLGQVCRRPDVCGPRGHPAGKPRVSHPKAVRDHEIGDLGQCRVASDAGRRQGPVQGRAPA